MKYLGIFALLATTACATVPAVPPPPPTPPTHLLVFRVYNRAGAPVVGLQVALTPELYREVACVTVGDGVSACRLSLQTGDALVTISAPGYAPVSGRLVLPTTDSTFDDITLESSPIEYTAA